MGSGGEIGVSGMLGTGFGDGLGGVEFVFGNGFGWEGSCGGSCGFGGAETGFSGVCGFGGADSSFGDGFGFGGACFGGFDGCGCGFGDLGVGVGDGFGFLNGFGREGDDGHPHLALLQSIGLLTTA